MASPVLATPSTPPPDPTIAIQYGILVQKAEAVPPAETVYNPGDIINVAYGAINVNYKVVTTFFGNDLATDVNPGRCSQIVFAAVHAAVDVRLTAPHRFAAARTWPNSAQALWHSRFG